MTGERAKTDSEPGKVQQVGAGPTGAAAAGEADRNAEIGAPSVAELSRRLADRAARQQAADPAAAAAARRAALEAYDLARERRLIMTLSVVLALTVGAAVAYFVSTIELQPTSRLPIAAALPEPSQEIASAAAAPVLPEPSSPPASESPPTSVVDAIEPAAKQAPLVTDSQPAPVEATPSDSPLQSNDVREIQTRLRTFGFNPGPVDGTAGRLTEVAVRRYQQARSQPQTGEVDRRLLEQLRQDPATPVAQQVAQRGARPDARASRSPASRRDPFEPVRSAGNRFGQWLDSLAR